MATWKDPWIGIDGWTGWNDSLQQTRQLLEVGGQICKILTRNVAGQAFGAVDEPIIIPSWDTDSTSTSPRKRIWKAGDAISDYPNPDSVRVFVDSVELHKTYSTQTIMNDNEFYVEVQDGLVGYEDNISIYLNRGYVTTGHSIGYTYTARAKSINDADLQPNSDTNTFRSLYGFTQYLNPDFCFRGLPFPNSMLISFPPPPPFDTRFLPLGSSEQWQGRAWTLGLPVVLHEFDIIYRVYDQRYYEVQNIEYNPIFYQGEWILLTQSFTLTQVAPNDVIRQFPIL